MDVDDEVENPDDKSFQMEGTGSDSDDDGKVDIDNGSDMDIDDGSQEEPEAPKKKKNNVAKSKVPIHTQITELKEKARHMMKKTNVKDKRPAPIASGLIANWKDKAAGGNGRKKHSKHDEPVLGGFDDSDVFAQSPNLKIGAAAKLTKAKSKLKVIPTGLDVQLIANNDSDHGANIVSEPELPTKSRCPKPCPATVNAAKKASASKGDNQASAAAPKGTKKASTVVSKGASLKQKRADRDGSNSDSDHQGMTANKVRMEHLPEFSIKKWKKKFLPTLFNTFYASRNPWEEFGSDNSMVGSKGGEGAFLKIVQKVVDLVYPEVKYVVQQGCPLVLMAYNRVNDKRSGVGQETHWSLKDHIDGLGSVEEVKAFCRWGKRTDLKYIRPQGRLESDFMISVAKKFLPTVRTQLPTLDTRKVFLLSSWQAVQYERVLHLYVDGEPTDLSHFSFETNGSQTIRYVHGLESISDERWEKILELCEPSQSQRRVSDVSQSGDLSLLDQNCATLFNFSSPTKDT
ncbi:hypothetical protein C8J56DRAFT_888981 [Mycena floridula]|nr:hypothetical protein C8J56DRAFT_888981 [Mycena floridula]